MVLGLVAASKLDELEKGAATAKSEVASLPGLSEATAAAAGRIGSAEGVRAWPEPQRISGGCVLMAGAAQRASPAAQRAKRARAPQPRASAQSAKSRRRLIIRIAFKKLSLCAGCALLLLATITKDYTYKVGINKQDS